MVKFNGIMKTDKSSMLENVAGLFRSGAETGATVTAICIGASCLFGWLADKFNSRKNKNNN